MAEKKRKTHWPWNLPRLSRRQNARILAKWFRKDWARQLRGSRYE